MKNEELRIKNPGGITAGKPAGFSEANCQFDEVSLTQSIERLKDVAVSLVSWCLGGLKAWGLLFLLLLVSVNLANAQAPYLGGEGDGYSSAATVFFVDWDPVEEDAVRVFPSRVRQGEVVYVMVNGLQSKLDVWVRELNGRLVFRSTRWDVGENIFVEVPTEALAAGVYLVEVRHDGRVETWKLIVLQE